MKQITDKLVMVRPCHFGYNEETATNNVFQSNTGTLTAEEIAERAKAEFDAIVTNLREHGIYVDVIADTQVPVKPDAVFPNNWVSLHADGTVITYPMFSEKRRAERREEVIAELAKHHEVSRRYAFEQYEAVGQFLEGTGSMVLDREHRIVYACLSERTDIRVLDKFCLLRGFSKVVFHAESDGTPVYHTNVLMALGTRFVVICRECIHDLDEWESLRSSFEATGKEIIEITTSQMWAYAGNMLQVANSEGESCCIMSQQALTSLDASQLDTLKKYCRLISSDLEVIERYGGGSARCMMAENFLPARHD